MNKPKLSWGLWIGTMALLALTAGSIWFYQEMSLDFRNLEIANLSLELSHRRTQSLWEEERRRADQTINAMSTEIRGLKVDLGRTQLLLSKVEEENAQLQEKVKLLDKLSELEATIAELKEKNNQIISQMSKMELKSPYRENNLQNVAEARDLIAEYRSRLKLAQSRLKEFKVEAHERVVTAQKESDQVKLLMGNNGYLVRNGKSSPVDYVQVPTDKSIKVEVQIIK